MSFATAVLANVAAPFFAVALAVGLHWKSLEHGLVYDDAFAITRNRDVLGTVPWSALLEHDFWGQNMTSATSHKSYRPLSVAVWRLLHHLDGSEKPAAWWVHALNVTTHGIVTLQVFFFARHCFSIFDQDYPSLRGFIAALLFASHPIHSEAVLGGVGFAELFCASLGVMSLHLLLSGDVESILRCSVSFRDAFGCLFVFAATFAKEVGITTFGTVVLWDLLVVPTLWASRNIKPTPEGDALQRYGALARSVRFIRSRCSLILLFARVCIALWFVWFYKFVIRKGVSGGQDLVQNYRRAENPFPFAPTSLISVLSVLTNHGTYAKLLVFPLDLCCDRSFSCTSYVTDFFDMRNLVPLALYSYIACVMLKAHPGRILHRLAGKRVAIESGDADAIRQAFFLFGLIVVPFLPASNIFFWVGVAVGERLLYFPSIGFVMMLADFLIPSRVAVAGSRFILMARAGAILAILGWYCSRTLIRVPEFRNEEVLFESAYKVCPTSVKVLQNRGIMEQGAKRYDKALSYFRTAQKLDPMLCDLGYLEGETLLRMSTDTEKDWLVHIRKAARDCPTQREASVQILAPLVSGFNVKTVHSEIVDVMRDLGAAYLNHLYGLPGQGCDLIEQAAWGRLLSQHGGGTFMSTKKLHTNIKDIYSDCTTSLITICGKEFRGKVNSSLVRCMKERASFAQLYATSRNKVDSISAAAYKYLRMASGSGCFVSPLSIEEQDLCRSRRPPTAVDIWKEQIIDGWKSDVSFGHRMVVHVAQSQDQYNPWFHRAWAEVLVWEGRHIEAAKHLHAAATILASALQGSPEYRRYLEAPVAPKAHELQKYVQKLNTDAMWLSTTSEASEREDKALLLATESDSIHSLRMATSSFDPYISHNAHKERTSEEPKKAVQRDKAKTAKKQKRAKKRILPPNVRHSSIPRDEFHDP